MKKLFMPLYKPVWKILFGCNCLSFPICWLTGGNTSLENNPKHDGDDGTSFLSPEGVPFLSVPLKGKKTKRKKARILRGIRL